MTRLCMKYVEKAELNRIGAKTESLVRYVLVLGTTCTLFIMTVIFRSVVMYTTTSTNKTPRIISVFSKEKKTATDDGQGPSRRAIKASTCTSSLTITTTVSRPGHTSRPAGTTGSRMHSLHLMPSHAPHSAAVGAQMRTSRRRLAVWGPASAATLG